MSSSWFSRQPRLLAQNTENSASSPVTASTGSQTFGGQLWMISTISLLIILSIVVAYGQWQLKQSKKALKFEKFKSRDLKKKLKLALVTIRKMEGNPDLVHAREFNLDYLRMRMDEEVFHYVVVNQIKMKVTQLVGAALRPSTDKVQAGVIAGGRNIDESFDVTYEVETQEGKWNRGVLFRISIKLIKLPTQSSGATVTQIIECVENFLAPTTNNESWQPAIQGQVVLISWDQKAKPTPLLVIEQSEEGLNITRKNPVPSHRSSSHH
ncbi:hypothetical protein WH8501_19710 [Crocosphaera watsonii WH 8501]|uniref:Uncharacterized protein n=5 Tax=Crocosphaera watsonii TaxID=263511 RepID=Q4C3Q7_CROWT|nr:MULTISPECIES: hypothetical protein [Crocosphaera]EAM50800.1 hypothetical protein CwatDRAFT_3796 [Crocosphaera watsonii WH 8501]MCH2243953.1 hypothetical protein [Crocosphaera sp.]NQZ62469.1 hypothetical protein [Crocosphaera sp.]CCQ53526.1 FIG00561477: hypothetical protein [Crocosphaera watsonii WH 8502]CCQ55060.1 hypothetical protein CWATWH0005_4719 [Crocosphaera watsonii WH 0005]